MSLFTYRRGARSGNVEFECRVLGGLPVIIQGRFHPPEPDVGIFHRQFELINILWQNGKEVSDKVYDKIMKNDMERIELFAQEYSHEH